MSWGGSELPSGAFTYTVYATTARPQDTGSFPIGKIVEENVVASGKFVIP